MGAVYGDGQTRDAGADVNSVIEADIDAIFADIGQAATYNGDNVSVVPGKTSLITDGSARECVRSFVVRESDVESPEPGDVIVLGGISWTVSDPGGEPVAGGRGTWTVQAVKQRRPTFRG